MYRYLSSSVLVMFSTVCFQAGCDRSRHGPHSKRPSESRSEGILGAADDAKTVIDKAVKAHGGENSFSCWRCGYVKYKALGGVVPAEVGDVTVEDTFQLPGNFKREIRNDAEGKE